MKKEILSIIFCMLLIAPVAGSLPSTDIAIKQSENETYSSGRGYSHDILGEFFTLTTCVPCKYSHRALKELYTQKEEWDKPFYYTTMVYDKDWGNKWADQRHNELQVTASPTVMWDGPFKKDQGSTESIEGDMAKYNTSIIACGNRNVKDIDLTLDVDWLGAVNIDPADGKTLVPIEQHMTWTNSEIEIDIEIINNEANQYNGHLHVYVNEVNSTLWDDKWGDPYTHAFLDYAWNQDVTISASSSWVGTKIWDGYEHQNGYDEYYEDITQDNIIVIASIFDKDNNKYADETTGMRTGIDTDPKYYDVYFGNTTPPPKVEEKLTNMEWFNKSGPLEWSTKYYWKVDIWDNNGDFFPGDEWSFSTRGNNPPNTPNNPIPNNGSTNVPIKTNLTWFCNDPNGDDVTYDVWFGDHPQFNMKQKTFNQTKRWWMPPTLEFMKKYYWYVVAWDEYGLKTIGPMWQFTTQGNIPPSQAVDPHPDDGDPAVPTEGVTLEWNGSDPNFGDTLYYDVYFDDVNPPVTKKVTKSPNDWWRITYTLPKYKTYYWRIDTWDKSGEFCEGKIWSFTTGDNTPPTPPIIDGPYSGVKNQLYEFSFISTDHENHTIKYTVKWGDGVEDITSYYANGTTVYLNHSWISDGKKQIRAMATDVHGATSDWSIFEITIPRNKAISNPFLNWLQSHPNWFSLLKKLIQNL